MKIPHETFECQQCELSPCVPCVERDFAQLPEHTLLQENDPRYGKWLWEDKQKFKEWFGDDVDPVEHGRHQAEHVAIPLIEHQEKYGNSFTWREAKLLVMSNIVHDYHEGITGDLPAPEKTEEFHALELEANQHILDKFLDKALTNDIRKVMGDFEGKTVVGRAFNAIENLGYFETGIKAWYFKDHPALSAEEKGKSYSMGLNVVRASVQSLEAYRQEFPYVDYQLFTHRRALREIC
jgi:hypothetical protein